MSGFQHASITKGLMLATGTISLFVAIADLKPYVHLQLAPHMTKYHQYWRLLIYPFAYTNSVEVLMALLTFYHLGVHVERSFGARKYAAFLLMASCFSTIAAFVMLVLFGNFGLRSLPAGSFAILGAIWYQYNRLVPSLYTINIFGMPLSSKILTYWYPILLLLHQFPNSIKAMAPGFVFSIIYTASTPRSSRIRAYRLPLRLHTLLSRLLSPFVDPAGSAPPRRADRVLPGEISESAAQTTARLQALARQVRAQMEIQEQTRRQVEEELTTRRNLSQALQALQRGISDPASRVPEGGGTTRPSSSDERLQAITTTEPRITIPDAIPSFQSQSTSPVSQRAGSLSTPRRSRFEIGGWVARAGEAVGIRTESPLPGVTDTEPQPVTPSQQEIDTIVNMFPNLSRDAVVRALQRSNHNTALAIESLLQEGT